MVSRSENRALKDNLPKLLSSFVGRQRELAEVTQLLRAERLITLTGAGGSGKTRLALRSAAQVLSAFEDGVWLTELAPLAAGELVTQAVATTLSVSEQGSRSLIDTLTDYLRSRQLLLVLDNCEHLILACAQLAQQLLQTCPSLSILATSREPLGIAGEVIRIVPPLSLPSTAEVTAATKPDAPRLARSEAVELFVARAKAADPGFELTHENAGSVAQICLSLDGMPLAIELAAARLRALSVRQVAELLGDRFELLTGGSRMAPARQRTLEATLDWSYALLADDERRVLQRVSVFAGGCTLQAAEAVCAHGGLGPVQVREAVAHLVDKSLVIADSTGSQVRYQVLETIREYGRKKLQEADLRECKDRHLDFFVSWAEALEPIMLGPDLPHGNQLFTSEHDNVRAALDWSLQSPGQAQKGLRLATAAWNFWRIQGYHSEGRQRLERLLAHEDAQAPTLARANALHRAALHAFYQSDYPSCKSLSEQSNELFAKLGPSGRNGLADSLELLAEVASETGEYERALTLFMQALPIYDEVGDLIGLGDTLKMTGFQAMRSGDLEAAKGWLERGLEVCRQSGEMRHISSALSGLGELAIRTGRYDEARRTLHESLDISRRTGERWNIAINLGSLAWIELLEGDFHTMAVLLRESLSIRTETGDRSGRAWCLEKLGQAVALSGRFDLAAMAFGAAAALRLPMGSQMDGSDRAGYESTLSRVREALGQETFEEKWVAGERSPENDVIELALAPFESLKPEASGTSERPGGLTPRELEVAALIAQGKSNREIAEAMTVGVKTVETYVTRILGKLGFDSRVQIATWAVANGVFKKEEQ